MGCGESAVDEPVVMERGAGQLSGLPDNFSKQDFQTKRGGNTIEDALKEIAGYGTDLKGKGVDGVPTTKKACFICCNTYTKAAYQLGVGPLNDSCSVAKNHKDRGYQVFWVHNPTPADFLALVPAFMKKTEENLTIFFTGHGANVKDRDGDEDDGLDEAMVFDTGHIVDDKLVDLVCNNLKPDNKTKVLLLTDCCHSGSIWDLQSAKGKGKTLPKNILSVSAAKDSQTAKQTKMKSKDQGIFSYFFWQNVNADQKVTAAQLEAKMNKSLARFKQQFTAFASSPNMLSEPILPPIVA